MGLFGKFKQEEKIQVEEVGYQSFSTPFLKVGSENLSLPFVDSRYQTNGYVPFGSSNLYPQTLVQMYYSSPLHGAIVDFKTNATIGGGYTFDESKLSAKDKVNLYAFGKKMSIKKTLKKVTKDLIIHGRVYFILCMKKGVLTSVKYVGAEKVRTNKDKSKYFVNYDWQYTNTIQEFVPYHPECKDGYFIYVYEDDSTGQDIYPLPQYTSALNFAFVSGELSYLQKSHILNSVFPSFAMMFPKKPQGQEEMDLIRNTVNKLKGAENAGKAVAFFANNKEQLPELVNIPSSDNDTLFKEASELITEQICFAHTIDPILLGVRTSGSLGNGSDIKQAYIIFEKNVVIPIRETVMDIFNGLLKIADIDSKVEIKNYQIINETIVERDEETKALIDQFNTLPQPLQAKVIENMTAEEIRALVGLKPLEQTTPQI